MNTNTTAPKIPVGISSCLLGEEVRYNGGHKRNAYIVQTLGDYFAFRPFCPEVAIGMGVPREPVRLVRQGEDIRCVGTKDATLDVTDSLIKCADEQQTWHREIYGYILKKDSPSCGMERVKLYRGQHAERDAVGMYAQRLMRNFPNLPVEEEGRLGDAVLRENFVQRIFIYYRWQTLLASGATHDALCRFHAQHKMILMSRNQEMARALGRFLSEAADLALDELCQEYGARLTEILKIRASRKNHVNVLQHIQGYLKRELDKDDKKELSESIEQYRLGLLPLIVPITLLRHHFRKNPNTYIEESFYMQPHPKELMLLNKL
ncbi:DUF1722 domain-containing protein [Exilibacterium tricleocarpae]|uniref:DUF1722 domain-containing protein n=1 Tax=Exilibacterium tricleocarpae TaxID=2591008 RepID=A0A545T619_9GAMM|nr:DUF523 and DUF1722 domain-containing protein [Exilibacterium tricleocarpae]TQV72625.1 DUF1722 domain-containing protein [Exilibacterium tricleocarpae]